MGSDHGAPLFERERELHALKGAVNLASEAKGSLLIVEGPAGIGKTRVLAEAAKLGESAGFLLRDARGGETEREMPFGVVRQLFEPLIERASEEDRSAWLSGSAHHALTALGRLDPDTPDVAVDAFAPINGLYWLTANLSDDQPVLLIVDDAQWSDSDSLRFIAFLARRLADLPVSVVMGVRTGEAGEPADLNALRLESEVLQLQPLSAPSVHELITRRVGRSPSDEFSTTCASVTAGNPFLVVEILRELGSPGGKLDSDAAKSIADLVPDNVTRSVLLRLGRFGDDAIALARAIAVLGRAPQLRTAAQLAGIEEGLALSLCDRLRDAEILAPGMPLEFVHPLVRRAVYRDYSEGQRSASHRRASEILSSTGAGALDVAAHLLMCTPNGDQWVATSLQEAALVASREGGYSSAASYLERALREPPEDPVPALYALGVALMEAEPYRAPQVLADALEGVEDPRFRVEVLRRLASATLAMGSLLESADRCDQAIEVVSGADRDLTLALEAQRYFMRLAAVGFDARDSKRIEAVASELDGVTPGERIARQGLAILRFSEPASVEEVIGLALPFPEAPWEIGGIPSPLPLAAAKLLAWSGRWEDARAELMGWLEIAEADGSLIFVSVASSWLSEVDRLCGRLSDAEARAQTAWEIAESAGPFSSFGWSARMNLAATLVARGDLDRYDQLMGDLDLSAGPLEVPLNPWPLEIRAHLNLARGDLESALADFLALGAGLERMGLFNPVYPPWRQEATELLARLGRKVEAEEIIRVAEERARRFGSPQAIGSVLRARALIEPRDHSIETLRASVAAFDAHGPPTELARSLIELGAAFRRDGQRTEAREPLRHALELAVDCGADGLEKRAREELAAAGSRPRGVVRTGVASLTASEARTAALAADGLNNNEIAERLFVTRRTVETHLTHAYEKLGIKGRRELAEALSQGAPHTP